MKLDETARAYLCWSRELSEYWRRPFAATVLKMLLSRIIYGRGPGEFNEYRFTTRALREWRNYLNESERVSIQQITAPEQLRYIEEDKIQFWMRCMESELPTIPITAVIPAPGHLPQGNGVAIAASPSELRAILEPLDEFDGFAKPLGGGQGYGAFIFDVRGGRVSAPDIEGCIEDLARHCTSSRFGRAGYVLQPRMRPHPDLSKIMPGPGLGTLRLTTFLDRDGRVEIPWAILKIPGPGQVVCNPRLGALMLAVDLQTGRLSTAIGPSPETRVVHEMEYHPVTGVRFTDTFLPMWGGVVDLVNKAAAVFKELPCLGWDVAITEAGPLLIETNWAFGIYTQQIALNQGLKREFREYYRRCFRS